MQNLKGIFWGIISAVTYGTNPLFGVHLLRENSTVDSMLFYRFLIGGLLLLPILILLKKPLRIEKSIFVITVILGFLFAFSAEMLFWSFTVIPAGIASTILFLYPVFVALIMGFFFRERIGLSHIFAMAIAFLGVLLLCNKTPSETSINFLGIISVILSSLSYAIYIVIIKVTKASKCDGFTLTFYALLSGTIFMLIKGYVSQTLQIPENSFEIYNILGLAIFPTVISITAIAYAIKYAGATTAAILGAFEPLAAVSISIIFLGETMTIYLGLGMILIIMGVTILTFTSKNAKKIKN